MNQNAINPKFEDLSWDKKHALCLQALGMVRSQYKLTIMGAYLMGDMMAGPNGETGYMKFRLSTADGEDHMLVIYYWLLNDNIPHITSYLHWLLALAEDTDLQIQTPVPNKQNHLVTEITVWDTPTDYFKCFCTVLKWIPGEPMWPHAGTGYGNKKKPLPVRTDDQLRKMGAALAKLHNHAQTWQRPHGFVRTMSGLVSATTIVEQIHRAGPIKYPQQMDAIAQAATQIDDHVIAQEADPANKGLCHGDPSASNFVVNAAGVFPIDFDACSEGLFLSDLCTTLQHMDPQRRQTVLEGYHHTTPISQDAERTLEVLIVRRLINELIKWWWPNSPVSPFFNNEKGFWDFVGHECDRFLSGKPMLHAPSSLAWYQGRLGL